MPSIPFVQLKKEFQCLYAEAGQKLSSRDAHRLAQGVMLSEFANAAEAYFRDVSDETGENAVDNVLIEFLRKYGAVTAPRIEVLAV